MGDDHAHPDTVALAVDMLVSALADLGLSAEKLGMSMLWVSRHCGRMRSGLRQVVQCHMDDLGQLAWFLVWDAPDVKPTRFALASDADRAAERIGRILGVRARVVS